MVKIYTKTGDKGETSLYGGKRVSKSDIRVEAYGTVDELNSAIGLAIVQVASSKYPIRQGFDGELSRTAQGRQVVRIKKELIRIQNDLLDIGSMLARPSSKNFVISSKNFVKRTLQFEKMIDDLTTQLPELRNFILPGGGVAGSHLHLCRTICRRVERRIVKLSKKESVNGEILQYFNRLSDVLFTMARFVNYKENKKETIWVKSV